MFGPGLVNMAFPDTFKGPNPDGWGVYEWNRYSDEPFVARPRNSFNYFHGGLARGNRFTPITDFLGNQSFRCLRPWRKRTISVYKGYSIPAPPGYINPAAFNADFRAAFADSGEDIFAEDLGEWSTGGYGISRGFEDRDVDEGLQVFIDPTTITTIQLGSYLLSGYRNEEWVVSQVEPFYDHYIIVNGRATVEPLWGDLPIESGTQTLIEEDDGDGMTPVTIPFPDEDVNLTQDNPYGQVNFILFGITWAEYQAAYMP